MDTRNLNTPEPPPQPGKVDVWPLVILDLYDFQGDAAIRHRVSLDMAERNRVGTAHYGTPLQTHNGRDPLVDAYQEALDLAVYLRQREEEMRPEYEAFPGRDFDLNQWLRVGECYARTLQTILTLAELLQGRGDHA